MKSFKQLMEEIREAKPVTPEKSSSSQGNPHGTAYEILVAAHMRRHISGHSDLLPEHYPHSVAEHSSDLEHGKQSESFGEIDKIRKKLGDSKVDEISKQADSDARLAIDHLQRNDPDTFNHLTKSPTARFVHVPIVSSIRDVVQKNKSKDQRKSMSSSADIIYTDGTKHIGIDTKWGKTGGVTEKGPTTESMLGVLQKGHDKNETTNRVKELHDEIGTTTDKNKRNRLMRELAFLHKNAFNAMSHEDKRKAASRLSNAGRDSEMKTFRMHRNTSTNKTNISEPAADFDSETKNKNFGAIMSGRGMHIFTHDGQGMQSFKRLGIKSAGSGSSPMAARGNVKRVTVDISNIVKKEKVRAIKGVVEKEKRKVVKQELIMRAKNKRQDINA